MLSTPDTKSDPHDVLEIAPDVVLVARAATDFPSLAPDANERKRREDAMDSPLAWATASESSANIEASLRISASYLYVSNEGSATFGQISQTDPNYTPRLYQFALKVQF